jgi:putative selenium metabolism hydrolase
MSHEFVLSLAQELVRAPSLPGDERAAAEVAARAMRALRYDDVTTDEYGSVIGLRKGQAPGPTVLFDAHLDTVAATNLSRWQHDPFAGEVSDGRLWGRGACDDKGPLAAVTCAVGSVPRERLRGQIIVTASVGEEHLTGAALAHILDRYPADLAIICEPTELKVGTAQKGRAGLVIRASGKSAHSSVPEMGENAVYKMLEAAARLRNLDLPKDQELGRGLLELTEMVSEPLPGAGFIPSACRTRWVARTLPGETQEQVLERLQRALAGLEDVSIQLEELSQRCYTGATLHTLDFIPGWRTAANDLWRARILSALRNANLPAETFAAPYGTNASISAGVRGIPSFILGPGSIRQAHVVDEWISIEALQAGVQAYAALAAMGWAG